MTTPITFPETHWVFDRDERARFLELVEKRVWSESGRQVRRYNLMPMERYGKKVIRGAIGDVASWVRAILLDRMRQNPSVPPFSLGSPKEAAKAAKEGSLIQGIAQSVARRLMRGERRERLYAKRLRDSKQAADFDKINPSDMPREKTLEIMESVTAILRRLPVLTRVLSLTPRDVDIFKKEGSRRAGADGLDPEELGKLEELAGVASGELRTYYETHEKNGSSNASDRQAWGRLVKKLSSLSAAVLLPWLTLALLLILGGWAFAPSSVAVDGTHQCDSSIALRAPHQPAALVAALTTCEHQGFEPSATLAGSHHQSAGWAARAGHHQSMQAVAALTTCEHQGFEPSGQGASA